MTFPSLPERFQVEYLAPSFITPDEDNPRTRATRHIKALAKSISEFGFNVPVLVDDNTRLIAGHGRLEAAKLLGLTEIPALRLRHLDDHQRRAFMIADNRLHDLSSWNRNKLGEILLNLAEADIGFDVEATGFSLGEIDLMIVEGDGGNSDKDNAVPEPGPVVAVPGDLFILGGHMVACADACAQPSYDLLMADLRADLVATDPPFNVPMKGHVTGLGKVVHRPFVEGNGEWSEAEFTAFLARAIALTAQFSRDGSLHYWAMDWRHQHELNLAARGVYDEQVNLCVWSKTAGGMGSFYRSQHELFSVWRKGRERHRNNVQLGQFGRNRTNVWKYPGANSTGHSGEEGNLLALHPTVKPVALVADILLDSTKRGDVVLDPFLGSGTTIIAAEKVGRRARGLELDPRYVDTIIRRWQLWTGEQARRADGILFDDIEPRQPSD